MNRLDFAVQLAKSLGIAPLSPAEASNVLPADLAGREGANYVAALYDYGIFTGTAADSFSPDGVMTRAMAATVFARAFDLTGGSQSYTDVSPNYWGAASIAAATSGGLFLGNVGGSFDPEGEFTSAHFDAVWGRTSGMTPITSNVPIGVAEPVSTIAVDDVGSADQTAAGIVVSDDSRDFIANSMIELFNLEQYDFAELQDFAVRAIEGGWGTSRESLELHFMLEDAYQDRFGTARQGFLDRQEAPPSAADILAYESASRALMRAAGLPENFYDTNEELQAIMASGVDAVELQTRIQLAYTQVQLAPLEVRNWYAQRFGLQGDDVLAAIIFDPETYDETKLQQMFGEAQVGGAGMLHGFTLSDQMAGTISGMGYDYKQAASGFSAIRELTPLFHETFGETQDFTAEGEGIESEFGLGTGADAELRRRAQSRLANIGQGGGQALVTNEGIIGLGSAE